MSSPAADIPAVAGPDPLPAGPGPADVRVSQRAADAAAVESERLHRGRLHTAWLHGSARTFADRITLWPWVLVGILVVVLIVAGLGIAAAFRAQKRVDREQQQRSLSNTVLCAGVQRSAICT